MIKAYINFNKVWDTLFGLIYGLMYVVWMSVLFKPFVQKFGYLNLFPFAQVLFDWLENYALASLANQFLVDGLISSQNAKLASVFCMSKWVCSGATFTLILVGIILMIARVIKIRKQLTILVIGGSGQILIDDKEDLNSSAAPRTLASKDISNEKTYTEEPYVSVDFHSGLEHRFEPSDVVEKRDCF